MYKYNLNTFFLFLSLGCFSQNNLVLNNNIYAVINNSCYLVVNSANANGIITKGSGGNILSENEYNVVKWNITNNTGKYVVPFTTGSFVKIPVQVNITSQGATPNTDDGIIFSTFKTVNNNNTPYASDVTNMASACNTDNSLNAVDRFWRIDAANYTTKPNAIIDIAYNDSPIEMGGTNVISEPNLKIERFNSSINKWETPLKLFGTANTNVNVVSGATIIPTDFHRTWTLVDESIMTSTVELEVNNFSICPSANAIITPSNGISYTLATNPQQTILNGNSFIVNPIITTTYMVTGTADLDACRLTPFNGKPAIVTVYPKPTAGFITTTNNNELDAEINVTSTALNYNALNYYLDDGANYHTPNFTHLPEFSSQIKNLTIFQVVKNNYGCADTLGKVIEIKPSFSIYIPNAFTPNEDGINDGFGAKGVGIKTFNIWIYDRWGHLIFESNDINKLWDGKAKGSNEIIKQDVYVWKATVTDLFSKQHNMIGSVTVLK